MSVAGHMYAHGLDGFSNGLEEFSKAKLRNRELVGLDEFRICYKKPARMKACQKDAQVKMKMDGGGMLTKPWSLNSLAKFNSTL